MGRGAGVIDKGSRFPKKEKNKQCTVGERKYRKAKHLITKEAKKQRVFRFDKKIFDA